jgi:dipeptidyl aminopeptidase/acylaminoacyl peptidase
VTRSAPPRPPRARDPYGLGPVGSYVGPALSVIGLMLIGIITYNLFNYDVPFVGGGGNGGNGGQGPGPERTPAPSNVVVVPPEAAFDGTIVYAKQGNIWVQQDKDVHQLTDNGGDSMPSFSPDGAWVYFIRSHEDQGRWPVRGRVGTYDITVPDLMRVKSDDSGKPERLTTGLIRRGNLKWAAWIRQPVLSPDGKTIALVTDLPDPDNSNVVLQFYDVARKRLTRAGVRENQVLGHQDPEWRYDGKFLLYTQNGRDGARGAPVIMRYAPSSKQARAITTTGYMQASYSPDGRYMAATRTTTLGTDVAILDANTGHELMRITDDGASWAPAWSPAGDGIAFLHIVGQTVDLRLARLEGNPGAWTVKETIDLTEVSGLDAASRPDWFIPPALLPALPTPAPESSAPGSAAPSGAASPSP